MCCVSASRLSIYNFVWGLLKATKKVYLIYPKVKKNKDTYGIHPTKFASSTQKHKSIVETPNQPIKSKIFLKKVYLVPYKCKGAENSYGGYPTECAREPEKQ
jgi:hypothetical protein